MSFTAFEYTMINFCVENPKTQRKDIITMISSLCGRCWHWESCKKTDKLQKAEIKKNA